LKFAISEASLFGMVKLSVAEVLLESSLQWLKVQVASAVVGTVMTLPSAYWPAGHTALTGLGVPALPQPPAMSDTE